MTNDDEAREARSVACADAPGRYSYWSPRPPAVLKFESVGAMRIGGSAGLLVTDEHTGFAVYAPPHVSQHAGRCIAISLLELASESEDTQAKPTPTQADVDALVKAAGFASNRLAVICESAKHDMTTKERSALSALNAALTPFQKG